MKHKSIENEIVRRASTYGDRRWLEVDFYRIRRKVAIPLPLQDWIMPAMDVQGIPNYPWGVWILWALEERILSLGWAGHWRGDEAFRELTRRDVAALSMWTRYADRDPNLPVASAARCLVHASERWPWLGDEIRRGIHDACRRLVDQSLPWVQTHYGRYTTFSEILSAAVPTDLVRNIPVMAIVGVALAARHVSHPASAELERCVKALALATLHLRTQGYSEAVAYDGFMFDFVADWLHGLTPTDREEVSSHPQWPMLLQQASAVAAPGNALNVAELSDTEPWQMPFHVSMSAKMLQWIDLPLVRAHLERCDLTLVRSESLAALHALPAAPEAADLTLPRGVVDAHYAIALRSGWDQHDVAVVVSACNVDIGHIQHDSGSLVIGTAGQWLISDPGYQQYMPTSEREFTLGPKAHNCPVINGHAQQHRGCEVVGRYAGDDGTCGLVINLTRCYDPALELQRVERRAWLTSQQQVVIADHIDGPNLRTVDYSWHGHPQAAWAVDGAWTMLGGERDLWFATPHVQSQWSQIRRLRGSRGQLTREVQLSPQRGLVYWWVFCFDEPGGTLSLSDDGTVLSVDGRRFAAFSFT